MNTVRYFCVSCGNIIPYGNWLLCPCTPKPKETPVDTMTLIAELKAIREERDKLREAVRFWSYCTYQGMRRECPEKESELREFCRQYGIPPHSTPSTETDQCSPGG